MTPNLLKVIYSSNQIFYKFYIIEREKIKIKNIFFSLLETI